MRHVSVGVAAAVALLSSCTTTYGSKIDESQFAHFQYGVTTVQDVEARLGPPQATEPDLEPGSTDLDYWYNTVHSSKYKKIPVVGDFLPGGHVEGDIKKVVFRFDAHGKLFDRVEDTGHLDTRDFKAPATASS